jgi:hypothetical protein
MMTHGLTNFNANVHGTLLEKLKGKGGMSTGKEGLLNGFI